MSNRKNIIRIASLVACLLFTHGIAISQPVYSISGTFPEQPLDAFLLTWEDSTRSVSAKEILADTAGTQFYFQAYDPARTRNAQSAYWAKISIQSEVDIENWMLIFRGQNWQGNGFMRGNGKVRVIEYEGSTILQTEISGAEIPAKEKSIPQGYNVSKVPFSIQKGSTKHLLINIEPRSFLYYPADFGLALIQPQKPVTTQGLFTKVSFDGYELSFSIFLGVLLMAFFYHLLVFFYLREPIYGWFSLWLFFMSITVFHFHPQSFIIEYLFPDRLTLANQILSIIDSLVWIAFWQFGRVFIKTKLNFPGLDKALFILFAILFIDSILGTIMLAFPPVQDLRFLLQGIANLAGFALSWILLLNKDLNARYFGFGALVATSGVVLGVLWFLEIWILPFDPFATAAFLQVFIYSFGLAYRRQLEAKDKATAEKQLLINEQEKAEQLQRVNIASGKFVPSTFLNFLGKENILDATLGDYVEKQVSVLFLDIRDYTSLSEKMTPKENFRFVQAFHRRMGPIISKYQGFVNQYLGDGIMAIFPEHAEGTLQAAIEMQHILKAYNQERIDKGKDVIRIGIGIHSGPLIMGIIGDEQRMDAATISDTVNAASRVEGLTKHFGASVLLSEVCINKLSQPKNFGLRYLGRVQVKGKEKAIKIYEHFDGEEQDIKELKMSTLPEFDQAIQLYEDKKLKDSHSVFKQIIEKNPKDLVAQKFLERLENLLEEGISQDWTAVEMMKTK